LVAPGASRLDDPEMRRLGLVVLGLAGCAQFLGLNPIARRDGGSGDTASDDADASWCMPQATSDDFDRTANPCGTWGNPFGAGSDGSNVSVDGTSLVLSEPGGVAAIGCSAKAQLSFTDTGVFAVIPQVMTAPSGYTVLSVTFPADGTVVSISHSSATGTIFEERDDVPISTNFVTYDPGLMKWWRLYPDPARQTIVAAVAQDGIHWQPIDSLPIAVPAALYVAVGAGDTVAPTETGAAHVDSLNICP
jgi:hypothetical protein